MEITVILLFLTIPLIASAQVFSPTDLIISADTQNPEPNEEVTVQAEYYLSDTSRATVSWYKNGQLQSQGTGNIAFTFMAGDVGEQTSIRAVLVTQEGTTVSQTRNFTPVALNLVWEAQTNVPPFYKGKALSTNNSPLRVVALPRFESGSIKLSPNELFYEWFHNGNQLTEQSGKGKNYVDVINVSGFGESVVSVTVLSPGKSLVTQKSISIPVTQPEIYFYEFDPLNGTNYRNALGENITVTQSQINIKGEPYFANKERLSESRYTWTANNQPLATDSETPDVVTLVRNGGDGGRLIVRLLVESFGSMAQGLQKALTLTF